MENILRRKAPKIHEDRIKRNIKFEYLDVTEYFIDKKGQNINQTKIENKIQDIDPEIIVMVICFSRILDFKFLLEGKGLLSGVRLKREINLQSKGKILTLSKIQKEFIQTLAKEENIEKKMVHIEGKVGSGKTLLGVEVVKMKLSHYYRKYNLNVENCQKRLRVIILVDDLGANLLKTQLSTELPDDIGPFCSITVEAKTIREGVLRQVINSTATNDFVHTIVMIDECFFDQIQCYILTDKNVDFIHCIRYNQIGRRFNDITEDVFVDRQLVFVQLFQSHRSSQPILDLAEFAHRHSSNSFPMNHIKLTDSFPGLNPLWIELHSDQSFIDYAKSELKETEDVMLIREEKSQVIENFCAAMSWKYCSSSDITGTEASTVIIYDHDAFRYLKSS